MDQGILVTVKKIYRRKLLLSLVLAMDGGHEMLDRLKNIDLLDVVGWIAESWDELEPISLVHSWRKLLDHSRNEFQQNKEERENPDLVDLLQRIPGCKEATDGDVGEWMGQDENCEVLGDGEIVAIVKEKDMKDEEESEDDEVEDAGKVKKMTHSEGLKAAEEMLRYFEEQGASAMDILFLHRLCDTAARRRNKCER